MLGAATLAAAYLGFKGYGAWSKGYAWAEMDWNQNGKTSIAEFFTAASVDKKSLTQNGQECAGYFKDEQAIKIVCRSQELSPI